MADKPEENRLFPQKVVAPPAGYPKEAVLSRRSGLVMVEVSVDADGKPTDVKLLKSVDLLDAAAVQAAKNYRYRPKLIKGIRLPAKIVETFQFSLS